MTQRTTRRRTARGGFTAIELVIAMVIIGLMAAAVMPRISRVVAEQRIRQLQQAVAADLEQAFALAMREHKPVNITYNTSTNVMAITDRATGTVLKQRYLGQSQSLSATAVTFSPTGGVTIFPPGLSTGTLTVTVTNGSYSRTISVTRAGMVTKS